MTVLPKVPPDEMRALESLLRSNPTCDLRTVMTAWAAGVLYERNRWMHVAYSSQSIYGDEETITSDEGDPVHD
jgi:hypothetical protein